MFNKPLLLALFVSLSLNGLFGFLSYTFYGERASALSALEVALDANKSLEKSYEKQETACKIADSITSEFQSDKKEIDKETEVTLEKLNLLVAKKAPNATKKAARVNNEETNVAGLDDMLPPELTSVLSEAFDNYQGQGARHAE